MIDTSVWVHHFRSRNAQLIQPLHQDLALTHPMVMGEIACGLPASPRAQTLIDITLLQQTPQASMQDVMNFMEREALLTWEATFARSDFKEGETCACSGSLAAFLVLNTWRAVPSGV